MTSVANVSRHISMNRVTVDAWRFLLCIWHVIDGLCLPVFSLADSIILINKTKAFPNLFSIPLAASPQLPPSTILICFSLVTLNQIMPLAAFACLPFLSDKRSNALWLTNSGMSYGFFSLDSPTGEEKKLINAKNYLERLRDKWMIGKGS